uniref:Uncharacterized protein n=1 Tax=Triticum urartu TaxID=4572 RepID=A0A8R7PZV4_TRIUA
MVATCPQHTHAHYLSLPPQVAHPLRPHHRSEVSLARTLPNLLGPSTSSLSPKCPRIRSSSAWSLGAGLVSIRLGVVAIVRRNLRAVPPSPSRSSVAPHHPVRATAPHPALPRSDGSAAVAGPCKCKMAPLDDLFPTSAFISACF